MQDLNPTMSVHLLDSFPVQRSLASVCRARAKRLLAMISTDTLMQWLFILLLLLSSHAPELVCEQSLVVGLLVNVNIQ